MTNFILEKRNALKNVFANHTFEYFISRPVHDYFTLASGLADLADYSSISGEWPYLEDLADGVKFFLADMNLADSDL